MLTFIWIDEAWVSLVNRAQSAVGAGVIHRGPNVSRPVHRLARLSGSVGSVSAGWRDELVTLLPPSAARCSPRLSVVLSFTGHVRTRWVCAASRALAVADAFPRSRRLFVRSARPRLAAWKARCHPDVSGWITRVRVRLRNGDVRGPGRRARGYLDPARDARAHHLVDLSTSDAERERRRYRHDGRADRRCRGRIANPALGSEDRTENVRRSDPVDGRQAAAPALEWELTRTRRVPCTRSSGDHHR